MPGEGPGLQPADRAVWEFIAARRPERFWEGTNRALRCVECSDKLCPRYDHLLKFYLERDKKM